MPFKKYMLQGEDEKLWASRILPAIFINPPCDSMTIGPSLRGDIPLEVIELFYNL